MTSSSYLYLFVLSITLICCSKNQESELIKYSEIGDTQINDKNNIKQDSIRIHNRSNSLNTQHLGLKIDTIITIEESEFMDRFTNNQAEKHLLLIKTDSIYFKTWFYNDSVSTFNAFYNLLDCFGESCSSIDLYSNNYSEKNYNLLFVCEFALFWIQAKENQKINKWEHFIKEEFTPSKYNFIIEQKSNENINWLEQTLIPNTFHNIKPNL